MGKFKVALIASRNCHDRTGAIAHQDIVGNPDRDFFTGDRVGRMRANKHAGLFAFGIILGRHGLKLGRLRTVCRNVGLFIGGAKFIYQRMFGCENHIGRAKDRVRTGGINGNLVVCTVHGFDREVDPCADRTANPALLHLDHAIWPIKSFKIGDKTVGIIGNAQHPLFQRTFIDRVITPFGLAFVGDFLVRQNRAQHRAPVDRHFIDIGQTPAINRTVNLLAFGLCSFANHRFRLWHTIFIKQPRTRFKQRAQLGNRARTASNHLPLRAFPFDSRVIEAVKQLQEDPLRPFVIVDIGRGETTMRVMTKADDLKLTQHIFDIGFGRNARMLAGLDGKLFCRQTKGIKAHGMQNVFAAHALEPCLDVGRDIAQRMADMQANPAWIGEHVQDNAFFLACVEIGIAGIWRTIGIVFTPISLPALFKFPRTFLIVRHAQSTPACQTPTLASGAAQTARHPRIGFQNILKQCS